MVMGIGRLLRVTLECYSRQFRIVYAQEKFRVIQNAWMSTRTPQTDSAGVYDRIRVHGQLAARRMLCSSAQPSRDVALFEHDRTRFFRLLSVFCGGQLLFWTYMGHFAYTGLKDTRRPKEKERTKSPTTTAGLAGMWSFEMNLGSNTWRYGFTLGCLSIGAGIVGLGILFCRRSVSQVVLHKGGRMVTISTQSPLGPDRGRRMTVPLNQVACHAHRHESPTFIPLKVKGHKFYFLLDKEGTLNNVRLFDLTVGAYRPF